MRLRGLGMVSLSKRMGERGRIMQRGESQGISADETGEIEVLEEELKTLIEKKEQAKTKLDGGP